MGVAAATEPKIDLSALAGLTFFKTQVIAEDDEFSGRPDTTSTMSGKSTSRPCPLR
jgi:hypothetical protein